MADGTEQSDSQRAMNEARSAALSRLRTAHLDEYNSYVTEEAKKKGIDWTPRPTAEQKAEQQLAALLEQHPHLADKVVGTTVSGPSGGGNA